LADSTIYIVALLVGVVCGIGCVALSKSKNRNAVGFFFLGFLLGVIGLIIALFIPVKEAMLPAQTAGTPGPSG
jgi:ascorbate-specific PTS system EIIC-type component UlaA